tara:strand:- start:192 stop:770 length:579 start_codon:yes stop_codon:yes gene_type:complete
MSDKKLEDKIIKLDPLAEALDKSGHKGGASKISKPKNLKEGVVVIRGTSKKKDIASTPGNRINEKYQGRYFFERAKTKKADKDRVKAAKSFAKTRTDSKGDYQTIPPKERLILKTTLTPREVKVGRRLFEKFAPKRTPFSPPSQRQGRLGRIIIPKSAIKKQKVDRKLTREVRKDKFKGGLIRKPKIAIKGY